jgi:hypothetical protein
LKAKSQQAIADIAPPFSNYASQSLFPDNPVTIPKAMKRGDEKIAT